MILGGINMSENSNRDLYDTEIVVDDETNDENQ